MIKCINIKNGTTTLGVDVVGYGARILQVEAVGKSNTIKVYRCTKTGNTLGSQSIDSETSLIAEVDGVVKLPILNSSLDSVGRTSNPLMGGVSKDSNDRGAVFVSSNDTILCENDDIDNGNLIVRMFVEV